MRANSERKGGLWECQAMQCVTARILPLIIVRGSLRCAVVGGKLRASRGRKGQSEEQGLDKRVECGRRIRKTIIPARPQAQQAEYVKPVVKHQSNFERQQLGSSGQGRQTRPGTGDRHGETFGTTKVGNRSCSQTLRPALPAQSRRQC